MSSQKLRSRKVQLEDVRSDVVLVEATSNRDVATKEAVITSVNIEDKALSTESTRSMKMVPWMRQTLHANLLFPFWKHLDDRGFGTAQPFICWLLIPFTLSMIVWYYSVIELIALGNWEAELGPLPAIPSIEEFTWGEL